MMICVLLKAQLRVAFGCFSHVNFRNPQQYQWTSPTRAMDCFANKSPDGPGCGKPNLATSLWSRACRSAGNYGSAFLPASFQRIQIAGGAGSTPNLSNRRLNDGVTASFGPQCLMARRLTEKGGRLIQLTSNGWDHHGNVRQGVLDRGDSIDRPIAGLIAYLKQRDMLKDSLS